MESIENIYSNGQSFCDWFTYNEPASDLIYKGGQLKQYRRFEAIANSILYMEFPPVVVSSHRSKSVPLPVVCFKFFPYKQVATYCFVRDNFYDIKICTISDGPVDIPYHLIYNEMSEETYQKEKARYSNYCYPDGKTLSPERMERKEKYLDSGTDDWYAKDWSGGEIFRHDNRIWRSFNCPHKVYCEGIDKLALPKECFNNYRYGASTFGLSLPSYGKLIVVLECIENSLEAYRYKFNDQKRNESCKKL